MNKLLLTASMLALLAGCVSHTAEESEVLGNGAAAVSVGTDYKLTLPNMNGDNGNCVDINGAGTGDGTKVQEWDCNGTGAQVWNVQNGSAGGYYKLVNPNSNKCLDVNGNGTNNGTIVQLWTCNNSAAQDWSFQSSNGYNKLVARSSNRCLDVTGGPGVTGNGTQMEIWDCNGNGGQTFNPVATNSTSVACTYTTWTAGTNYNPGQIVKYNANGNYYQCVNANPGYDPTVSTWFWTPTTCGVGAPPPAQPPPAGTAGIAGVLTEAQFNSFFPSRNSFYTYNGLISTASAYASFCNQSDTTLRKREAAAFLANMALETGDLVYVVEQNTANYCSYCDTGRSYGCPAGSCQYYGRGPIQISWNFNYYSAGNAIGSNLLNSPGLVQTDANVSWKTATWYWQTQPGPGGAGTNCHDAISTGFGETIKHINGSLECPSLGGSNTASRDSRINKYNSFCNSLGVSPGSNTSC